MKTYTLDEFMADVVKTEKNFKIDLCGLSEHKGPPVYFLDLYSNIPFEGPQSDLSADDVLEKLDYIVEHYGYTEIDQLPSCAYEYSIYEKTKYGTLKLLKEVDAANLASYLETLLDKNYWKVFVYNNDNGRRMLTTLVREGE